MLKVRKRNRHFHLDLLNGREHVVRGSLGTRNKDAADRLGHRIELALSEGPRSIHWADLRNVIPSSTFARIANYIGFKQKEIPEWNEFHNQFEHHLQSRVNISQLAPNTFTLYRWALAEFSCFLEQHRSKSLKQIDPSTIDAFKDWRLRRIRPRKNSNGLSTLSLNIDLLHHAFAFAVEKEYLEKNPVRFMKRQNSAVRGAQPFNVHDLRLLKDHTNGDHASQSLFGIDHSDDQFLFMLFRWTGFRRSDAVALNFENVVWDEKIIDVVCKKNRTRVKLPIHAGLFEALNNERRRRDPLPSDPVLVDPATGRRFDEHGVYRRIVRLGRSAGVRNAHPHRFRDTFAIRLWLRCRNPYYVAQLLGDTLETVLKYYSPFVDELRDRAAFFVNDDDDTK